MNVSRKEFDLLTELAREWELPPLDESKHVTARMLAAETGITSRAASDRLDKLVLEGKLKRERVRMPNGYRAWGYYRT